MKSSNIMLFIRDLFTKYLPAHYKPDVRVNIRDMKLTQSGEVIGIKKEK